MAYCTPHPPVPRPHGHPRTDVKVQSLYGKFVSVFLQNYSELFRFFKGFTKKIKYFLRGKPSKRIRGISDQTIFVFSPKVSHEVSDPELCPNDFLVMRTPHVLYCPSIWPPNGSPHLSAPQGTWPWGSRTSTERWDPRTPTSGGWTPPPAPPASWPNGPPQDPSPTFLPGPKPVQNSQPFPPDRSSHHRIYSLHLR